MRRASVHISLYRYYRRWSKVTGHNKFPVIDVVWISVYGNRAIIMTETQDVVSSKNVKFKNKTKKQFRKRTDSSEESNDSEEERSDNDVSLKLEEMKTLQKLRKRQNGVSIVSLAFGKKATTEDETLGTDPFKLKTGGMVHMKALKMKRMDDAYSTGIGTQFSAETNKRDEDEEMMKYIEDQLSKRKGIIKTEDELPISEDVKYCSPEEAALQAVPDHLRASSTHRSEEMLSNQMLSGIPEVDLGIDAKIRNIEATEEAKLKLLWERHSKKDGPSQFVPTNMAVNFVQHNRFNIEDPEPPKKRERQMEEKTKMVVVGSAPEDKVKRSRDNGEKATDDYHYERFKKQFRRY